MATNSRNKKDRDLIAALTDDYLNVYLVRPEEDIVDVIKLNGFITDGLDGSSSNLKYSAILDKYTKSRVFPEDWDMFLSECGNENLISVLSQHKVHQGRYRILTNNEIHYCGYKYVKVSGDGESLSVVAAFRNVDHLVQSERKKLDELRDMQSIMDSSQMGIWHITLLKDKHPFLEANPKMRELLGIPENEVLSPENLYDSWFNRIDPKAIDSVKSSVAKMMEGSFDENTYKWNHPTLGERFVRCGGSAKAVPGGFLLSGYHYDVTDQIKKERRSSFIINSLARSYDFVYYIRLYNSTYIRYRNSLSSSITTQAIPQSGDVMAALDAIKRQAFADEYREQMESFISLDTIDERMQNRNVLVCQFKNKNQIWFEWSYIVAERNEDGTIKHLIWAIRKIDDEKQAEIRRQQILDDNIAANKAKTMFLQNMSHEIRTPLNAMFGFAQLLGLPDGSWSETEKKQYNTYILNSYNMLDMLIGDIIDIADSEHGNYRINIEDVHVNDICRNALLSIEYRVPFGVELKFTSDISDEHTIKSDGRRIQQVLINYLTNACKHTSEGEIHLHCSDTENPGKLTFSVKDTGTGVPADKADIIFNRFTKLNTFVQGSGLGLNICRMVASKLGGEVYLDKTYTGGARFVFVVDNK